MSYDMFTGLRHTLSTSEQSGDECKREEVERGLIRLRCPRNHTCANATIAYVNSVFLWSSDHSPPGNNFSAYGKYYDLHKLLHSRNPWLTSGTVVVINSGLWWTWKLSEGSERSQFLIPPGEQSMVRSYGPWILGPPTLESIFQSFMRYAIQQLARRIGRTGRVVLRLDHIGFDSCNQTIDGPLSEPPEDLHGKDGQYNRPLLYVLNHLAAAECARHASCQVLDVSTLSSLRPDALKGAQTGDCVHFRRDSDVVATWSHALSILVGD